MDILGVISLVLMLVSLLITGVIWTGINYLQTKNYQHRFKKYKWITVSVGLILSFTFFIILLIIV